MRTTRNSDSSDDISSGRLENLMRATLSGCRCQLRPRSRRSRGLLLLRLWQRLLDYVLGGGVRMLLVLIVNVGGRDSAVCNSLWQQWLLVGGRHKYAPRAVHLLDMLPQADA